MELKQHIGIKIRNLRLSMNLSQSALARMVGYKNKASIAKIEAGKTDLPQSKIILIAKVLGTTPTYLIDDSIYASNINNSQINTLLPHFDGIVFTKTELSEIENYIEFVKSKRKY